MACPIGNLPLQPPVVVLLFASCRRVFFELFIGFLFVVSLRLSLCRNYQLIPFRVAICSCTPLELCPSLFAGQFSPFAWPFPSGKASVSSSATAWILMVNPCFSRCFSIPIFHDFSRSAPRFGWLSICHDFDCFCILTIPCTCTTCNFAYRDRACLGFRPH